MSHQLLNHSADLSQLSEEGYAVQILGGKLVFREVPYLDEAGEVRRGILVSELTMAGDVTTKPKTHTVHWVGDKPCDSKGGKIRGIAYASADIDFGAGLHAGLRFSSKPAGGFSNYHQKMKHYVSLLMGPARSVDSSVDARINRILEDDAGGVFHYLDTASDRAGIAELSALFEGERIAIVGLGGTGSYVLDLVAKTPVEEIRLFDADDFLQHNAFRGPGAPSLETLKKKPKKVEHFQKEYSRMHSNIVAHPVALESTNMNLLDGITFVFVCIDKASAKRAIFEKLEKMDVPLVDTGMGFELDGASLGGILRVTASTPEDRETIHSGTVSLDSEPDEDGVYGSNIQIADMNMMNAAMAVMKWKKIQGFYRDLGSEHHSVLTTDTNHVINRK